MLDIRKIEPLSVLVDDEELQKILTSTYHHWDVLHREISWEPDIIYLLDGDERTMMYEVGACNPNSIRFVITSFHTGVFTSPHLLHGRHIGTMQIPAAISGVAIWDVDIHYLLHVWEWAEKGHRVQRIHLPALFEGTTLKLMNYSKADGVKTLNASDCWYDGSTLLEYGIYIHNVGTVGENSRPEVGFYALCVSTDEDLELEISQVRFPTHQIIVRDIRKEIVPILSALS